MASQILANTACSISELKANPVSAVAKGEGAPVVILNRNTPAFYCIPADAYEVLMDRLEDAELAALVREREGGKTIAVDIDDL